MGIKLLNKFLNIHAPKGIKSVHLSQFYGKKICIDSMIYIYKFLSEDGLIEKMYLMGIIFKKYNITPIFIFDGKPPKEKYNEIQKRNEKRSEALLEYEDKIKNLDIKNPNDRKELIRLKRQTIRVRREHIISIQELVSSMGFKYLVADGEADVLCAKLIHSKKVDACLSDDMDMFAYNCPKVLRHLSLLKHKVLSYDFQTIIHTLNINKNHFTWLCCLSGSDYFNDNHCNTIFDYYKHYIKYKTRFKLKNEISFIDYLKDKKIIDEIQYDEFHKAFNMFNLNTDIYENIISNLRVKYDSQDKEKLYNILKNDNFII